jgi:hypothetical protein
MNVPTPFHQSQRSMFSNLFCGNEDVVDATSPRREPNPSNTDVMISKDLTCLSPQEQEQAWNDLHGVVPDVIPEDPEFVAQQLYKMDIELKQLETKKNAVAYQLAKQLDQGYVDYWSF